MARTQNKLLTGTIIVIHSEKEVPVVKNTGNIKENIQKSSEVAPLDCTVGKVNINVDKRSAFILVDFMFYVNIG